MSLSVRKPRVRVVVMDACFLFQSALQYVLHLAVRRYSRCFAEDWSDNCSSCALEHFVCPQMPRNAHERARTSIVTCFELDCRQRRCPSGRSFITTSRKSYPVLVFHTDIYSASSSSKSLFAESARRGCTPNAWNLRLSCEP